MAALTAAALASAAGSGCGGVERCPEGSVRIERAVAGGDTAQREQFCALGEGAVRRVGPYVRTDDAGRVVERGRFDAAGRRSGTWRRFWEDGSERWLAEYADGRQHGRWVAWHANGNKQTEGAFADGKKHGPWKRWRDDGTVEAEGAFHYGRKHGAWTTYHDNGKVSGKGRWAHGQRVAWTAYRRDGKPRTASDLREVDVAGDDACREVVVKACEVLRTGQCEALAGMLEQAMRRGMTADEHHQCRVMLADPGILMALVMDLVAASPQP